MEVKQIKCKNCGADLEINFEKIIAYCPYCRAKLSIDLDDLSSVLVEKEKTKQKKDELEYKERREERKAKEFPKLMIGLLIFMAVDFIALFLMIKFLPN